MRWQFPPHKCKNVSCGTPIPSATIACLVAEVFALKHESRILGQWSNPVSGSGRAKPVLSMGERSQILTSSIMEKPQTGLDECPRILLSCFRARNSELVGMVDMPRKVSGNARILEYLYGRSGSTM